MDSSSRGGSSSRTRLPYPGPGFPYPAYPAYPGVPCLLLVYPAVVCTLPWCVPCHGVYSAQSGVLCPGSTLPKVTILSKVTILAVLRESEQSDDSGRFTRFWRFWSFWALKRAKERVPGVKAGPVLPCSTLPGVPSLVYPALYYPAQCTNPPVLARYPLLDYRSGPVLALYPQQRLVLPAG